jgi:hypothetical protein
MRQPWDSIVSVDETEEGTTLSWMNRTGVYWPRVTVPIYTAILVVWTCLWFGALYGSISGVGGLVGKALGMMYAGGMLIFGALIGGPIYTHFKRKVPESITLLDSRLEYEPGGLPWRARACTLSLRAYFRWVFSLFRPKHHFRILRTDLREVTIEQDFFGPCRLVLHGRIRRIRCADCLPQRDQVWLAATLNEWCAGEAVEVPMPSSEA